MDNFLEDMKALALKNRTIAVLGNGSWAPQSTKLISNKISEMKDMTLMVTNVTIKSSLKDARWKNWNLWQTNRRRSVIIDFILNSVYKGGVLNEISNYHEPPFRNRASIIAKELSERLNIPVYDKAYIEEKIHDHMYESEAEAIRRLAEQPCIILGRCASDILRDRMNVLNIFVCADQRRPHPPDHGQVQFSYDEAKEKVRDKR